MKTKDIQDKFDILFTDIESLLSEAQTLEERKNGLDQQERDLRSFESKLEEKKADLDRIKLEQQREREYIAAANSELAAREQKSGKQGDQIEAIKIRLGEVEAKRLAVIEEQEALDKRRVELKRLEASAKESERKIALFDKELAVDRERKRLLDLREKRIEAKEKRLQIDNDYLGG